MAPSTTSRIDPELLKHLERPELDDRGRPVMKTVKRRGEEVEEPVMRQIAADEVFGFAVRGETVSVVTTDGRKFSGPVPKGWKSEEQKAAEAAEKAAAAAGAGGPPKGGS